MKQINGLITRFEAESAIEKYRIVKFGTADNLIGKASAASDAIVGISIGNFDIEIGEGCDVMRSNISPVVYGGNITRGQPLTSDADGKAIVASGGQRIIGFAEESGVLNDIGSVLICPGIA